MTKQFVRALFATTCLIGAGTAFAAAPAVPTAADGIGGVVASSKGPEAGVWVIAETTDLPTRFIKIVVTDDAGRFMIPDLPKANYQVWVRGYGLVDSQKVASAPGKNVNLTAVIAPDAKAAAQYYPANYWESLFKMPDASEFPGTGPKGNGISPNIKTQQQWVQQFKNGCHQCHQMGDAPTRTLADNTPEGWAERITKARGLGDQALGDHGADFAANMQNNMTQFGRARALAMYADWSQRIEKGELPKEAPPRPQGIERNFVLTSWDWSNGRYNHDNVSTDRHNPSLNGNGPIWGVIGMWGYVESINPKTLEHEEFGYKVNLNKNVEILPPDQVPDAFPHNPMLDQNGNLWITDRGRYGAPKPGTPEAPAVPAYCTDGNVHKYAKYWPQPGKARNTAILYYPKTKQIEGLTMCNDLHHLMMGSDKKTMYFSGTGTSVVSWVDVNEWTKTKDPVKSMGWCPMVLDTNSTTPKAAGLSDVAITPDRNQWNDPAHAGTQGGEEGAGAKAAAFDPKKDTRVTGGLYGTDSDISDGSMWFAKISPFPTSIVRFNAGSNPPETCRTEMFEATLRPDGKNYEGYNARGMSVDSKGVAWVAFAHGRLGKLDRSLCKVLSGPTVAKGQHCPEGWKYYDTPGPKLAGINEGSADFHYLMWVDLYDTLGLGKDVPIVAGSNSDSLLAFDAKAEKWNIMRVPYPRSFHTRGMDGRIDDPKTGWKGKGVYATYASQPVWHQEGGDDGTSGPQLIRFQVRPDPLAH